MCAVRLQQAHFDCVPANLRVVDGAKSRWCNLVLIDSVIYLSEGREINESSRRSFNQPRVLIECIIEELRTTSQEVFNDYRLGKSTPSTHAVAAVGIEHPWTDIFTLRTLILSDPTTKSKEKFISIVDYLLNHPVLRNAGCDFEVLFNDVVHKVIFAYPQLSGPSCLPAIVTANTPALVSVSLSEYTFDPDMFDDVIASELDTQPWELLEEIDAATAESERPMHPLPWWESCVEDKTCALAVESSFSPVERAVPIDQSATGTVLRKPTAVRPPKVLPAAPAERLTLPAIDTSVAVSGADGVEHSAHSPSFSPFPMCNSVLYAKRTNFGAVHLRAVTYAAVSPCVELAPAQEHHPMNTACEVSGTR